LNSNIESPKVGDGAAAIAQLAFTLLQNNRFEDAAVLLDALADIGASTPRTLAMLALARLRMGQAHEALQILDDIAAQENDFSPCHLIRAQALVSLGQRAAARASMHRFLATQS